MRAVNTICIFAAILSPMLGHCESFTLETYYPSPAGIYTNITVTSSTVLARDGGAVNVGTPAKPAKLDVNGNTKMTGVVVPGNLTADPTDTEQKVEGAIYFNTTLKRHRVFQNGAWQDLGGSGEVTLANETPCNADNAGKKALFFVQDIMVGGCLNESTCEPAHLTTAVCKYVPGGVAMGFTRTTWAWAYQTRVYGEQYYAFY